MNAKQTLFKDLFFSFLGARPCLCPEENKVVQNLNNKDAQSKKKLTTSSSNV